MDQLANVLRRLGALKEREAELRPMLLAADEKLLRSAPAPVQAHVPNPATAIHPNGSIATTKARTYEETIAQIRGAVKKTLPKDAVILVVSKGDPRLLELEGRESWHFPQVPGGGYAGHHPADSAAAIDQLEMLRSGRARYLLLPNTSFWWLEHYNDFRRHLDTHYYRVRCDDHCVIFCLEPHPLHAEQKRRLDALSDEVQRLIERETQQLRVVQQFEAALASVQSQLAFVHATSAPRSGPQLKRNLYAILVEQVRQMIEVHLPAGATVLVVSKGDEEFVKLGGRTGWHFPQNGAGAYAGHYPATSAEAIDHLEGLRTRGADYLVLPNTAYWWLVHYDEFQKHLDARYERVWTDERCIIYQLRERTPPGLFRRVFGRLGNGATNGHAKLSSGKA